MMTDPRFDSSATPVDKRGRRRKKREKPMLDYFLNRENFEEEGEVKGKEEKPDLVEEDYEDKSYSVGSEKAHSLVERHGEPMIDKETHRLAVVNMDWDHIKKKRKHTDGYKESQDGKKSKKKYQEERSPVPDTAEKKRLKKTHQERSPVPDAAERKKQKHTDGHDERQDGKKSKKKRAMEEFRPMRTKEAKVVLDSRFSSMMTDPRFDSSATPVDKRGRRRKKREKPMLDYFLNRENFEEEGEVKGKEEKPDLVEEDYEDKSYSVGSEKAHSLVERHGEPMIDKETHRLAVVNMDWDHIKAVDLYMVMTSSLPKGGRVLSVAIYPSELGLKCMENESTSSSKLSQLPAHELNRLRYYYAVVVCDSSATANHLYMTLDGNEFLETTNVLDLQFIPDSREFKHPARDVATESPPSYKELDFETRALQQCRVKLTSDDNEPEHKKVLRRKFTDDEGKKGKKGKDEVAEDKLPDIDLNKDDRLEKHMNSIKWGDKETFMFIRICAQEMIEKENRVGPPSLEMYQRIRAKLLEENINRTTSELKTKWKNTKKLYDFWMKKIQPKKVQERTDIFWKKILKTRCSKVDYKNLRNGPPAHLDLLHIMFGKELDKEQVSTATKKLKLDLNNELADCKEQIVKPSDTLCLSVAKVSELEDLCNAQQEEILTLQKQLTLLSDKLKLADENAIEAMATCEQQKGKIKYLEERLTYAECQILKGHELRKKLHNTIMELKGNIRVFCRVRPLRFDGDSNSSESAAISFPTSVESAGRGIDLINQGKKLCFLYDKVFDHAATQQDVFVEISQLVQSALDGYKVCIFAYGQTGSGKTYTMMGKPDEKGIIPRSLEQIFKTRQSLESQGWNYSMKASMLEIYNETIRDLLIPRSNNLDMSSKQYKIEHDPHGNVAVSDLSVIDVFGIADVTILLKKASKSRSVGKTQMNEQSSRSHFVFTLKILGSNEKTGQHVQGALNLIDLAGSERLERSGAIGDRLKETKSINRSLSALSSVISAIARGDSHIPFRNSKLTQLLQPCLGGDSKTLMFVNISPEASSVGETISSLNFAERVNDCEIGPLRFAKRVDACDIGSPRHLTQSRLNYSKFKAKSSSHH